VTDGATVKVVGRRTDHDHAGIDDVVVAGLR
jgi:hypothetical protein